MSHKQRSNGMQHTALLQSLLLLPFCAFAAASSPSDFRIELELNNPGAAHTSFAVQCTEGCDWDQTIVDCPAGESVCRATIGGHRGHDAIQDSPSEIRAMSGSVCVGIGIASLEAARMNGLRVDESAGDEQGSVVGAVTTGSPADLAGFNVGDLLTTFNSLPILDNRDLFDALQGMAAGQSFEATLYRGGAIVHVNGTLGTQTTAHTCHAADAQLLQTAITPEELPSFKLVISAPNWRFTARCLEGCVWTEAGYWDDSDHARLIVLDQRELRPEYLEQ